MHCSLPIFLFLAFLALFGDISVAQNLASTLRKDGDYTIAGLFQIHRSNFSKTKSRPEVDICESTGNWKRHSYFLVQAMRFSIEEINNSSSLLPNVTLGYEIYDTCSPSVNFYSTLSILSSSVESCHGHQHIPVADNYTRYLPKAVAIIGPDSSEYALTTAILSGIFLMPEVSYEATSPLLSLKRSYSSFLRTIPSDHLQAEALVYLLKAFQWTWVVTVASNNTYGHQGLQTLVDMAIKEGICFAYQTFISVESGTRALAQSVKAISVSNANVAIIFANKVSASVFFQEVVRQNVTGKVWLGTEDWSLSQDIWGILGIHTIGTVIGVATILVPVPGMWAYEAASRHLANHSTEVSCDQTCSEACSPLCSQWSIPVPNDLLKPSPYDTQAAFSVYSAIYAVAHSLHHLLGCRKGVCRKDTIYPWQLLKEIKDVDFILRGRHICFDSNGDPLTGYDFVTWKWVDQKWSYDVIGSYSRDSDHLVIHRDKIQWHSGDNQVPVSVCSKDCAKGEEQVHQRLHHCCFDCVACSPGTFLNKSDFHTCQPCRKDQWAPARSDTCFSRTTVFLNWSDRISCALLTAAVLLLLLVAGTMGVFVRKAHTPVVKSAGGSLSFVMLSSLACANISIYFYFGVPTTYTCLLRIPMYTISFNICVACMAARSFQIILIFKLASKAPGLHEAWKNHHGCNLFIGANMGLQGLMFLIYLCTTPPFPHKSYEVADQVILLECKETNATVPFLGLIYNGLLGMFCFAISYMGADLPNSYNEAKCITFSLIIYFVSLISYFTTISVYKGKYLPAIHIASNLLTLFGVFGSYFLPKIYIILFQSELNTQEHFQMSIQSYTKRKNVSD